MTMKNNLKHGDIFYLQLPCEKYVFGRVLFDVDKQYLKKENKIEHENYLTSFRKCQLVEMYKGLCDSPEYMETEVLITRTFVYNIDSSKLNKMPWGIVGHNPIDYTNIDFPEVVGNSYNAVRLMRGELTFELKCYADALDSGIMYGPEYPSVIADACLFLQGKKELIEGYVRKEYLSKSDLLYMPKLREKLYKEISVDPNMSYYNLAKEKGYDLGRLY